MRVLASFLLLTAALSAAGCSRAAETGPVVSPVRGPAGVPDEQVYAAGERIAADLTMHSSDEGGRRTSFRSGYRPDVAFGPDGHRAACAVRLPDDLAAFPPGETHRVVFECSDDVVVDTAAPGFVLLEADEERGFGDVVFTGG
ncbi:hypothetical protein [Nocardiopsis sp. YSL2]|uniref:hypothetical protein n=1 Tax=Nocardiopsis sp. YSL2 TaxID=2939492 RepID=UPI0026F448A9|nr:hypothetical protein [Nocardiopsis sp. YSL2]